MVNSRVLVHDTYVYMGGLRYQDGNGLTVSSCKVTTVGSERDAMASSLSQTQAAHTQLQCDLEEVQEGRQLEVASMLTQLEGKTRAGEWTLEHTYLHDGQQRVVVVAAASAATIVVVLLLCCCCFPSLVPTPLSVFYPHNFRSISGRAFSELRPFLTVASCLVVCFCSGAVVHCSGG